AGGGVFGFVGDGNIEGGEPVAVFGEALEHHGDAFGAHDVGVGPQDVGQGGRDVFAAIGRMAKLVGHRAHPVFGGADIGEDADVTDSIDVGAEGVRAFAGFFEEVAAFQHVVDLQANSGIKLAADFLDVHIGEGGVEIDVIDGWRLLEER